VGLDGSEAMLVRARATPTRARYVQGDLLALPFDDASVDHVFSMEALYYVAIDAALAEAARVLRPGGHLAVCADFYEEHVASHVWPEELGLPMDLRSAAAWEHAVAVAGFEAVRSALLPDPTKPDHPGTLAVFGVRC
jgi:ubiquinone/menaquinone biosynthesis C-methylase UbiE